MKKTTLLYAEDEKHLRKDHIIYLQSRYEFNLLEADDGLEAWELYQKYEPDIVITDITMPNMDGIELARKIRQVSSHTKIIIATAHSEHNMLMQALDMYVVKYIVKPINRVKLNEAISLALETLPKQEDNELINKLILGPDVTWLLDTKELYIDNQSVKLSKSELSVLDFLCKHKNVQVNSYDIFTHVWCNDDKEYSSESVRTLIKKIRKKLPKNSIENIYGGLYKLHAK